jgi:hydroxymethylpyrimidine/phosphomethylpyrimidine kinase
MDHRAKIKSPIALTIAGSDPSSGAGLQADLETFAACHVHGLSIVTAVTAQTPNKFNTLYMLPKKIISVQLSLLLSEYSISAVKTGLLYKKNVIDLLIRRFRKQKEMKLIVDPIMRATVGKTLLQPRALESLKKLISSAYIVTPNLHEASILSGLFVRNLEEMRKAVLQIYKLGPRYVLIKGGHLKEEPVDLFYDGEKIYEFEKKRIMGKRFHGLGCRFSAALAAFIAQDFPILDAVQQSENYIDQTIPSLV